jgi:hypothetical protein
MRLVKFYGTYGTPKASDGLTRCQRYRLRHAEKIRERNAKWRRENPNYNREYNLRRKAA